MNDAGSSSPGAGADSLLGLAQVAILHDSTQHPSPSPSTLRSATRASRTATAPNDSANNFYALGDDSGHSNARNSIDLGGVDAGLATRLGIDATIGMGHTFDDFDATTPTTGTIGLPGGTDYDYFVHHNAGAASWTGDGSASASASGSGGGGADDGDVMSADLETKLKALGTMDNEAHEALEANSQYENDIVAVMRKLSTAWARTQKLETLVTDLAASLGTGSELKVTAPGTQTVSLPWFKHYHGKDLPPNADGQARDLYLSTIRHVPWTVPERAALKKEIVEHNQREIGLQAQRNGQDIYEVIGKYSPQHFVESTEFLDWDKIALVIPRRTPIECKIQWLQHDHPKVNQSLWSKDESQRLYAIAEARGGRDWVAIAAELGTNRTASNCLWRYRRRPGQERLVWSEEDDAKLKEAVGLFGENWQSVARFVGRHSNQCINRWTKSLRPMIRKGRWAAEEDEALRSAVESCGTTWKIVAQRVKGRTDAQCRERWVNTLDPKLLDSSQWSPEEEATLVRLRDVEGMSWSEIAVAFGGRRTDNHCLRCYKNIIKRRENPDGVKRGPKQNLDGVITKRKRPPPTMIEGPNGEQVKRPRGRPRKVVEPPPGSVAMSPVASGSGSQADNTPVLEVDEGSPPMGEGGRGSQSAEPGASPDAAGSGLRRKRRAPTRDPGDLLMVKLPSMP